MGEEKEKESEERSNLHAFPPIHHSPLPIHQNVFLVIDNIIYCVTLNRLAAIFLVLLLLFNLIGYKVFFFYMQEQSDQAYLSRVENGEYDESRMLTIKVDLDMPYLPANSDFERVDGEILVDGKIYKYVKRKVHNGQLVLLCLPDEHKTKLHSASRNYFFNTNIGQADGKQTNQKAFIIKAVISEYDAHQNILLSKYLPAYIHHEAREQGFMILSTHLDFPGKPPEQL